LQIGWEQELLVDSEFFDASDI